jgi:hypothetical protein
MPSESTVHIAIELSVSSWLIAARLPGAEKSPLHRIEGGDTAAGASNATIKSLSRNSGSDIMRGAAGEASIITPH